ncbi:hypothetical protein QBC38DRAFT_525180 [Podospora fimiseda]|uniref:Ecp2 effector protein domain-containing protein n=1 Tax=Podospora fimiseda TaxID=252190 RepID=A0AAN6YK17_9PEZI|nr:hypothetical protein QBC38DRAFT_525180 [Podospora fimiseda]
MQLSILIALIAPLLLNGVAVAAPTNDDNSRFVYTAEHKPSLNTTSDVEILDKRGDACYNLGININDVNAMINDLRYNNPWGTKYLPHKSVTGWWLGGTTICLYNDYLTENTHVTRWEAAWVTEYIRNMCGYDGNGNARGGKATCHGDSGLSIRAELHGWNCVS